MAPPKAPRSAAQRGSDASVSPPFVDEIYRQGRPDGARKRRRVVETLAFSEFALRIVRALGRRLARGDLDDLRQLHDVAQAAQAELHKAVTYQREHRGASWQQIGDALGIRKQSAAERFKRQGDPDGVGT